MRLLELVTRTGYSSLDAWLKGETAATDFIRRLLEPVQLPVPPLTSAFGSEPSQPTTITMSGDPNCGLGRFLIEMVRLDHTRIIDLLLEHGADPLVREGKAFMVAAGANKEPMIKRLVSASRCQPNILKGQLGSRLLACAIKNGARDVAKFLIQEVGMLPSTDTETVTTMDAETCGVGREMFLCRSSLWNVVVVE